MEEPEPITEEKPPVKDLRKRRRRARKASELLRVYRHVFKTHRPKSKNGKALKEEPNIALIRDIKEKTPDRFVAKMQELEAEYAASRGEEGGATAMDEGSRKVLDLVDQILDDIQAKAKPKPAPRQT